jgi:hypothetical protein
MARTKKALIPATLLVQPNGTLCYLRSSPLLLLTDATTAGTLVTDTPIPVVVVVVVVAKVTAIPMETST